MNGLAGTGKTTITQTVAERTFADGQLGASFFCSRDFDDRSSLRFIFPTLAVQLARKYTRFRSLFIPLVESNPGISHQSLYEQMHKMIVQPLKESKISTVIIIDALDECADKKPASVILSVLGQFVSQIPAVKFLVTGRPEPRIWEGFRLPLLAEATDVFVLHEVEPSQVADDILLFFRHEFSDLAHRRRGLGDWPTKEQLDLLCERAAGLFVYAVATVKFIDKQSADPRERLDLLLRSPECSVRESKTKFDENTTLDSLYTSILRGAFGDDDDPDDDPKVRSVLGAMILAANPVSPSTISMLLGLDALEGVFPRLSSAQSLLILKEDINSPVRPFHKSFPDFIIDPDRCTNKRFFVSPPTHHSELLIGCLNLMNRMLEKNMCKLPEAVANSDVSDLKERAEQYMDPALQYACRSWHTHLFGGYATLVHASETTSALHRFLETKFLFWLEALSVLGAARNAIDALQAAADRLEVCRYSMLCALPTCSYLVQGSPVLDLVNDCSYFVTSYFRIIDASSPHIYHSALVLSPETSMVRKLYGSYAQPFTRAVRGVPTSWDSNAAITLSSFTIGPAVWSPCNRFIAVGPLRPMRADILDSATLQRLQSLEPPPEIVAVSMVLIFSPDIRTLTCLGHAGAQRGSIDKTSEVFVISWDLETGGIVSVIKARGSVHSIGTMIAYSIDGKTVGVLHQSPTENIVSIFNVVSGTYMHDVYHSTTPLHAIWTHGEFLRMVTDESTTITILEVGFTPEATCVEVETLVLPEEVTCLLHRTPKVQFLPASYRLALIYSGPTCGVLIWSFRDSKCLLFNTGTDCGFSMTFSSDGCFFGSSVFLWRETSTGYTLHATLPTITQDSAPLLSPNGESLITVDDSVIQLWHTKKFTTSSGIPAQVHHHTGDFLLGIHADRQLAVVTRREDNMATVVDLASGLPQLTIETPMKVYGLGVIGDVVVIIGNRKAITRNLPGGDFLPDGRMSVEDGIQAINLGCGDDPKAVHAIAASISPDFRYIATLGTSTKRGLYLYDGSTGQFITHNWRVKGEGPLWFTPDGTNVCCTRLGEGTEVMSVIQDNILDDPVVELATDIEDGSWGCPWVVSGGYQVTNDGWILGADRKRLLMLPPPWQSHAEKRVWNGRFLALLHGTLPEVVILELEP